MTHVCPVCGYQGLPRPAANDLICPSCGTQFGYHDCSVSHAELRLEWIRRGLTWHSRILSKPSGWNPYVQLFSAGFGFGLKPIGTVMGHTEAHFSMGERPSITYTLGAPIG